VYGRFVPPNAGGLFRPPSGVYSSPHPAPGWPCDVRIGIAQTVSRVVERRREDHRTMTGPGQPTDPAGGTPNEEPTTPPAAAPPPATPPPAADAAGTPAAGSGQVTPPPPPAAPTTPPAAASGEWAKDEKQPEWVQQAQNWRPAEVASGPAPGVTYADLTTRIIAYIIDAIILSIGFYIVFSVLLVNLLFSFGGFIVFAIITAVLYGIATAVYFVYTWTTMKASPGQRVLNLMTVNESDGAALTQNQAITRWAYLFGPAVISQAFSFGPGAGFGFGASALLGTLISLAVLAYYIYLIYTTANDSKRQGFHDKQSGTVVVKTAPSA
jgi:uncharacterized RDD family membrane protein YckC